MRLLKKLSVGQANVEFIGGFFLFIIAVLYAAFSTINTFPSYYENVRENNMRLQAWDVSENFIAQAATGGSLDDSKMPAFTGCIRYNFNNISSRQNYQNVKFLLNISDSNDAHITVEEFPVALLDTGDDTFRSGEVTIDGSAYTIDAKKDSSLVFNATRAPGGSWTPVGGSVFLGADAYDVVSIGTYGDFVMFRKNILDCGP